MIAVWDTVVRDYTDTDTSACHLHISSYLFNTELLKIVHFIIADVRGDRRPLSKLGGHQLVRSRKMTL